MATHEAITPPEQPYLITLTEIDPNNDEAFKAISLPFAEQLFVEPPQDQWGFLRYGNEPPTLLPFTTDELTAIGETILARAYLHQTARERSGVAREMIGETQLFPYSPQRLANRAQAVAAIFGAVRPAIRYAAAKCNPSPEEVACLKLFQDLPDRLPMLNNKRSLVPKVESKTAPLS